MKSKSVLPIGIVLLAACPPPPGGGETESESSSEESTEATGEATSEATGETTGDGDGDGDGDLICDPNGDLPPAGPYPSATVEALPGANVNGFLEVPDTLCVDLPTLATGTDDVWVQVIQPRDTGGNVPTDVRFPALFFSHGNQQSLTGYQETLEGFAREGVVVVNVHAGTSLADVSTEPETRQDSLVCAARWLATNWEPRSERLNCDAVFSGHSNAGQGAALAANQIQNSTPSQSEAQFLVEGLLSVTPRRLENPLPSVDAVPALVLASTTENDVPGQQQIFFSNLWDEEEVGGVVSSPLISLVHAYDVEHDAFGGNGTIQDGIDSPLEILDQREKGAAIFRGYGKAFLRHTLFSPALSDWAILTGGAFPSEVEQDPGWWNYLPGNPTGVPQIFADVVFQTQTPLGSRLQIDSFQRAPTFPLSPASGGSTVTPLPLGFGDIDQVRIGEPTEFVPPEANLDFTVRGYETTAIRIDWSAAQQGGLLRWDFPAPVNVNLNRPGFPGEPTMEETQKNGTILKRIPRPRRAAHEGRVGQARLAMGSDRSDRQKARLLSSDAAQVGRAS